MFRDVVQNSKNLPFGKFCSDVIKVKKVSNTMQVNYLSSSMKEKKIFGLCKSKHSLEKKALPYYVYSPKM